MCCRNDEKEYLQGDQKTSNRITELCFEKFGGSFPPPPCDVNAFERERESGSAQRHDGAMMGVCCRVGASVLSCCVPGLDGWAHMQKYMATDGMHKAVPTRGENRQSAEKAVDVFLNKHNVMMPGFTPGAIMQSVRPPPQVHTLLITRFPSLMCRCHLLCA